MDSPQRRYNRNSSGSGGRSGNFRCRSRSRSRSRERNREHRRRNSRSRSRERCSRRGSIEKDLYRDIINDDYKDERSFNNRSNRRFDDDSYDDEHHWKSGRDRDNERKERDYRRHNSAGSNGNTNSKQRYNSTDSDDSEDARYNNQQNRNNKTPCNTIIVVGLKKHVTEADIRSALVRMNMRPLDIRLIRNVKTGASRGFAFVEFNTVEEAQLWMEMTQGTLELHNQCAKLQYGHIQGHPKPVITDWYCVKCGSYNFRRRFNCFKCNASRGESETGGEGNDEISNILTKKIMLRNLDALTTEESVLTAMQKLVPELAKKITKILVSRDALTQTSRGICYLNFETLVDSMNMHNALTTLEPALQIDNRDVTVNYSVDHENREIVPKDNTSSSSISAASLSVPGDVATSSSSALGAGVTSSYTLADVPRLAEYSASIYASTPEEHAHYLQYYTEYYINEINKGEFSNLPNNGALTEANSGAAVALSAIQRKQKKMNSIETTATSAAIAAAQAAAAVKAAIATQSVVTPKGNDGKVYATPDVSLYQYDETSGYYYDPTTGLYYDAHSQYYYNNETGAYLYWDQRKSTYVLATAASAQAAVQEVVEKGLNASSEVKGSEDDKKDKVKDGNKHDKVKVAKKIVKDMEKWAKQLNQKKDYTVVATPQPILTGKSDIEAVGMRCSLASGSNLSGGYADVGFSILEKKDRNKLNDYISPSTSGATATTKDTVKLPNVYGSESDDEPQASAQSSGSPHSEPTEKDYVDFQKLTCLLCKRAFQSLEILQKHLKMSNLHKENLAKLKSAKKAESTADNNVLSESEKAAQKLANYRDRAKERRLKYGESDPPPPNRSRERFESEIKSLQSRQTSSEVPAMPICSNNVGNRLLQKMGWSEGQGLGRKNQGRTQIIEAEARSSTAGLGNKSGKAPGDDYKTYIKKMMKSRYESA